jgi:hypothetical protein
MDMSTLVQTTPTLLEPRQPKQPHRQLRDVLTLPRIGEFEENDPELR